jgi:hypothetical protein
VILGRVCLAHPEHHPAVPIEQHHVQPRARGGIGTATVQLCANAHGQVHALLDDIEAVAVSSPYALMREVVDNLPRSVWAAYPGPVRVIAYKGWLTYGAGFIDGLHAERYRLWTTAGRPRAADVPAYHELEHAARWSKRWRKELLNAEPDMQNAPGGNRGRWGGARHKGRREGQAGTAARWRE